MSKPILVWQGNASVEGRNGDFPIFEQRVVIRDDNVFVEKLEGKDAMGQDTWIQINHNGSDHIIYKLAFRLNQLVTDNQHLK